LELLLASIAPSTQVNIVRRSQKEGTDHWTVGTLPVSETTDLLLDMFAFATERTLTAVQSCQPQTKSVESKLTLSENKETNIRLFRPYN
jgi:hypothetical protein